MAGFANDANLKEIVVADNCDFTGGVHATGMFTLDGQLLIGSSVTPNIRIGSLTSNDGSITIAKGHGTLDLSVSAIATYISFSPYIVGTDVHSGYNTISAAIAAAAAVGNVNVYIKPKADGSAYTENVTLSSSVSLVALGNVTVLGKMTWTGGGAGYANIYGLTLQTNSDYCLEVSAGNASNFKAYNCTFVANNNNAIHLTGQHITYFFDCNATASSNAYNFFTVSKNGDVVISGGYWTGSSSTASTVAVTGVGFDIENATFSNAITATGTGNVNIHNSLIGYDLTTNGTGANSVITNSLLNGVLTIGAGAACSVSDATFASNSTNVITGAGTLNYGLLKFLNSHGVNVATQNALSTLPSITPGIVTLAGDSGSATGSTVTITGGATGLTTSGSSATITLAGTLVVSNGGTGRASSTAYAVICGGTTSTAAQQSVASVGTSGQVLTSNGAGALPSFKTASGGGNFTLIQSIVVSSPTAFISFTSIPTSYTTLFLAFNAVEPDAGAAGLFLRVSCDNGSTYQSTQYQSGTNFRQWNSTTYNTVNNTSYAPITTGQGSNVNAAASGYLYMNMFNILQNFSANGQVAWWDGSNWFSGEILMQQTPTVAAPWNAFLLAFAGANINQGTFNLYGLT